MEVRTRKRDGTAGTCSRPVVGGAEEMLVMKVQHVQKGKIAVCTERGNRVECQGRAFISS